MKTTISREKAVRFINATGGKLFSVKFIKRTNGAERTMHCRKGVKKYLAKNPKCEGLDFKRYDLIPVFDMDAPAPKKCTDGRTKGDYRSIPADAIIGIMIAGKWFDVV